ncbi:DUF1127 domain-containing protein [Acuticoccus sp.]|uniref:DUF1127 domain-containing protein n=1 Tax=Acuticoccus sp. TaxID=1904378 RepID=UPI003B529E62
MEHVLARTTVPSSIGWRRALSTVQVWLAVWSERRSLERLDPRLLDDIGLTPDDARRECARRPWDTPAARSRD